MIHESLVPMFFRVDDHCFVCQEIIDHEGNFVAGNVDCFELPGNDLTYESTCSQEGKVFHPGPNSSIIYST